MADQAKEKATVTFQSEKGDSIVVDVTGVQDGDEVLLNVKVNFGPDGAKAHQGMYVAMLNHFIDRIQSISA